MSAVMNNAVFPATSGGGGDEIVETYPYKQTSGELSADPTDGTTTYTLAAPGDTSWHVMTTFLVGGDYAAKVPDHVFFVLKWSGATSAATGTIKAGIASGDETGSTTPGDFTDLTDDVAQTTATLVTTRSGAMQLAETATFPFTVAILGKVSAGGNNLTLKMYQSTYVKAPVLP